jgi:hypothetical protein
MVRNGAAFGSSVAANLLPSENGQCERGGDKGCVCEPYQENYCQH